jgi:hypothetical protein
VSPLDKKDHLTDGKIFFDCFIKLPYKINKTKFKIKQKEYIPVLFFMEETPKRR